MWHEARKQERMIRGMIVDYRRRAERRKDYYEKIKAEPTQFLQIHGRRCKIHLDPAIAAAGDSPAIMMPWQGDTNNMIDRFDARAHLDFIPEQKHPEIPVDDLSQDERHCNYERYRILAQNVFLGISEEKFLKQLAIEEQFGVTIEEKEAQKDKLHEKKGTGAAIGYNYNDPTAQPTTSTGPEQTKEEDDNDSDDSDLEIIDVDLSIDVTKMIPSQAHELNAVGPQFGMAGRDLFSFLTGDADEADQQRQLAREEKEKAMFAGRKSRRERRMHRDKRQAERVLSPPSYAAPSAGPVAGAGRPPSRSPSRSPSPAPPDKIQFITSFGGDDDEPKPSQPPKSRSYADKVKLNLKKVDSYSDVAKRSSYGMKRSKSPVGARSRAHCGPYRAGSRSRSRSAARRWSPFSRSRSRSRHKYRSPSRSVSRSRMSRSRYRSRSRSRRRSRSRSRRRSNSFSPRRRSRSVSYEGDQSPLRSNAKDSYNSRRRSRSYSAESVERNKPTLPRYYGRKKEGDKQSSSELSVDSESSDNMETDSTAVGAQSNANQTRLRLSGPSTKAARQAKGETLTLKERLKKKMQAQIARQLRADKKAEAIRLEKERSVQARREAEMRELALKLRRKQRELRHRRERRDSDSSRSRSYSTSRDSDDDDIKRRSKSRSKSADEIPVWDNDVRGTQSQNAESADKAPSKKDKSRPGDNDDEPQPGFSRDYRSPTRRSSQNPDRAFDRNAEGFDRTGERFRSSEHVNRNSERSDRSYERFDRNSERFDRNSERLGRSSERFDRTSERFDKNSERFDRNSERFDRGDYAGGTYDGGYDDHFGNERRDDRFGYGREGDQTSYRHGHRSHYDTSEGRFAHDGVPRGSFRGRRPFRGRGRGFGRFDRDDDSQGSVQKQSVRKLVDY